MENKDIIKTENLQKVEKVMMTVERYSELMRALAVAGCLVKNGVSKWGGYARSMRQVDKTHAELMAELSKQTPYIVNAEEDKERTTIVVAPN